MPIQDILALLIAERQKLDAAIQALGGSAIKRRGRPPKNSLAVAASSPEPATETEPRKKRVVSSAARKRMAAAQRKRWAAIKAEANQPKTGRKKTAKAA
jgi:hypothetical protein